MRIAALYDIRANLPALEAALEDVRRAEVDELVVGGDVVPGPMPRETLARLLNLVIPGLLLVSAMTVVAAQGASAPDCAPSGDRAAQTLRGSLKAGEGLVIETPAGWILRLVAVPEGWLLQVTTKGREEEDLARLTPPLHATNPRVIEGWHFRNAGNTGPNDGSVNAPQRLREFIFSPLVGREIQGPGATAGPTVAEVEQVAAFGRGWLWIESYSLTPPRPGERAAFQSLEFSACLTWPAEASPEPLTRAALPGSNR